MFWRAPVWVIAPLLLSVLLVSYLQFVVLNIHLPALWGGPVASALYATGRSFAFAPMLVAVVSVIYQEPERRDEWAAIFRVALMMTGAQLLLIMLQQAERLAEGAAFRTWYGADASRLWFYGLAAFGTFTVAFNAALWVRLALLLPKMACGEVFPLKAAWNEMRGHYLQALLVSFITMTPWYVAQRAIQQYIIGPMAAGHVSARSVSFRDDDGPAAAVPGAGYADSVFIPAAGGAGGMAVACHHGAQGCYCAFTLT